MDEKLVLAIVQYPVLGLCFYFIGTKVAALGVKIDEQTKLCQTLMDKTLDVLQGNSAAMAQLSTVIQERLPRFEPGTKRSNRTKGQA